jgi:hypothetical protein
MNTQRIEQPPTFVPPPQYNHVPPPPVVSTITPEKRQGHKFKVAFFITIAFVVLSHPIAYRITNQVVLVFTGKTNEIITELGGISLKGMLLHVAVFFVVVLVLFRQL